MSDTSTPIEQLLSEVEDPVLFHTLGRLGLLRAVSQSRSGVDVEIAIPLALEGYPARGELERRIRVALGSSDTGDVRLRLVPLDDDGRVALGERITELDAGLGSDAPPQSGPAAMRSSRFSDRTSRTRVLAISSGKGGVGKSSVTVNLAVALARLGHRVGLLDADIYGFSVPRILEVGYPPLVLGKAIIPPVSHGVRCISMGFFSDEDKAIAWRGPMLHKALEQFLVDVHWGTLDYLVVDMPPGTGDVALSIGQQLPRAEVFIVTTPQIGATRVAQRAAALAKQLRHPVRGVIENMSWFAAPDGVRYTLFGSGGGAHLAESLSVPLLAQIPLIPKVGEGDDDGVPDAVNDPTGEMSNAFRALAVAVVATGPPRVYRSELSIS
ncbi:MAG TPA: P-loop NTPase [Acidimicrobiales bacterium]|jgi:ATP-binding protein involved in chromosome partitioning|nr:P-loop NTPase [Acidimicrobiales bacterium]